MSRARVKICGITRLEDALVAVDAGVDALGFVFYAPSPRAVDIKQACDIISQLPCFVTTTALFVNAERELIDRVIADTRIDLLQFHGDEPEQFCQSFSRPYIKAIRMKPGIELIDEFEKYSSAQAILLDAYRAGVPGGTGEIFDWDRIPSHHPVPLVLAGGLNCNNIAEAVRTVSPYAVDVSGGVELTKGIKDPDKIKMFIDEVTRAN